MSPTNDTHAVLMEATYRTLATQGYEGLTMRAVAERAGKSRGLLHYHFDDKDDLVYEGETVRVDCESCPVGARFGVPPSVFADCDRESLTLVVDDALDVVAVERDRNG